MLKRYKNKKTYVFLINSLIVLSLIFFTAPIPGNALPSDGTEDITFYNSLGTSFVNGNININTTQSDGKILVAGSFTTFNGNTRNRLVRLNANGTEDTDFYTNLGTGFGGTEIKSVVVQSDGKILVAGWFTTFNGNTRNRLVRLNANGTEDTDFYTNLGTGFDLGNGLDRVVVQSDGKILAGGDFADLNGNTRNGLVRLNANGTEDTDFYTNLGTAFNGLIKSIVVQPDGKILVGGWFDTFNGNSRNYLVRLNANGTEDTDFYTNLGTAFDNYVYSTYLQLDGKILIGGAFTDLNGNTRERIVRLNTDGTEDTDFYTNLGPTMLGQGLSNLVRALAIQSDNKILVGGDFQTLNGNSRKQLIRLNTDGTEDTDFYTNLGSSFSFSVFSINAQSDDTILVSGSFTNFNGNTRRRLVRLSNPTLLETVPVDSVLVNQSSTSYSFSSNASGNITYSGGCNSSTTNAIVGVNNITFENLTVGAYDNCTIQVTNGTGTLSNVLAVSPFTTVVHSGGGGDSSGIVLESETIPVVVVEEQVIPVVLEPIQEPEVKTQDPNIETCLSGHIYNIQTGELCPVTVVKEIDKIIKPAVVSTIKPEDSPKPETPKIITPKPEVETITDIVNAYNEEIVVNNDYPLAETPNNETLFVSEEILSSQNTEIEAIVSVGFFEIMISEANRTYQETLGIIKDSRDNIKQILETKEGNTASKLISVSGVVLGAGTLAASVAFATPLSFAEIPLIPLRLWTLFLGFLGVKKNTRKWGVVYDSKTKQPLDPVYLTLKDLEGRQVASTITDIDGRYGFLVSPGTYKLFVNKTNYTFPSNMHKENDELYHNLYYGEEIVVNDQAEVVVKNIPLDRVDFSWNEYEKERKHLTSFSRNTLTGIRISNFVFVLGFFVSLLALVVLPKPYNGIMFTLYVIIFIFKKYGVPVNKKGSIFEKSTNAPLSNGIVKLYYTDLGQEVAHAVTDKFGKFYCLVKNGTYSVVIEKKDAEGKYLPVYKQNNVTINNGVLDLNFNI